jgi:DNA-binding CsgD family transcriptional regulator
MMTTTSGDSKVIVRQRLTRMSDGVLEQLITQFPDLIEREMILVRLLMAKLTKRPMALQIDVRIDSVKKAEYRLWKKMGIEPEVARWGFFKEMSDDKERHECLK